MRRYAENRCDDFCAQWAHSGMAGHFQRQRSGGVGENEDEFGDSKLLDELDRSRGATAADVCQSIVEEVRGHARGQRQSDDLTLIVAKIL